jgi:UDP:flavonoid glycosyltransferase YjiC (YdhE family)
MGKVVFFSNAYWGDVMPFVPIANRLAEKGHDVVFALPPGFHELLGGERFSVVDSGCPLSPSHVAGDPKHERLVARDGLRFGGALVGRYYTREWVLPYLETCFDALATAGKDADVFVTHPTSAVITRVVSEELGVPMVTGHLFPMILDIWARTPSPVQSLIGAAVYDRAINRWRREHGLDRLALNPTNAALHDGMLLLWPEPWASDRRWPATWEHTGFTLWEGPTGSTVPPDVESYLDAGDPPVVVTFGSSAASVAQPAFEATAAALDALGLRGLFLTGDERNAPASMRDHPGVFRFAPLTAVLPRARAIVQSGSHGTNAAAMAAGVPSVTVPFLIDQQWNGRHAAKLGLGEVVKGGQRTPDRLRAAIASVTGDPDYTRRAQAFAASIAGADGVTAAAAAIERVLPFSTQ